MWHQINAILNDATERVLLSVAGLLPGILALAVVVLIATAAAILARMMIRRSLQRIDFDKMVDRWGFSPLSEWSPGSKPSLLIAAAAYWAVILIGLLIGLNALDPGVTSDLVLRLFEYVPNVIAAVLIIVGGVILARFAARGVLISAVNMQLQYARLLSLGVKWLVVVLAGAMALEHLGIGGRIVALAFGILFGGIVLALALAVGLGSKDMVGRELERQAERSAEQEAAASRFHHL